MNKINVNTVMKNITAILCALIVVALLLPFAAASVSTSTSAMGQSYSAEGQSQAINGLSFVFGGGILGILFGLIPIAILASCFIPQIGAYKKYICLGGSILGIILQFLVPGQYHMSAAGGGEGASASVEVKMSYQFGFWIILILFVAMAAIAVIQFFNLKGNKVFDTINAANDAPADGVGVPNIDFSAITDKLGNLRKSAAPTSTPAQPTAPAQPAAPQTPQPVAPVQPVVPQTPQPVAPAQPVVPQTPQPVAPAQPIPQAPAATSSAAAERENSDYIMDRLDKLFAMKEKGILTDEEFQAKKAELLEKM